MGGRGPAGRCYARGVWSRVALLGSLVGCGFQASALAPVDAAVDALDAGSPGCWPRWRAHDVVVSGVAQVPALVGGFLDTRDPWLSGDGARLYVSQHLTSPPGGADIFMAARTGPGPADFGAPTKVTGLSTAADDGRPSLTADERTAVISTKVGPRFQVELATRPDRDGAFSPLSTTGVENVSSPAADAFDPTLTATGDALYLAPRKGAEPQHIVIAARTATGYATPTLVTELNSAGFDADPAPSPDGLVMLLSSTRAGAATKVDLYYATRPTATAAFEAPRPIPGVNGPDNDGDPVLSADGCTLYFASDRNSPVFHVYSAQIAR